LREPKHWKPYYLDPVRLHFDLQFSLSDRVRYYWSMPEVGKACTQLLESLAAVAIPMTLLSQYLPAQYAAIRDGRLRNEPRALVLDGVAQVLCHYDAACNPAV
jgi:D-tagatose-1,6-bisphosphate aldolase subunit GatZ/KbaZ